MKTAIVTGGCSAIGHAIVCKLIRHDFNVVNWCKCQGTNVLEPIISRVSPDVVVHVAETGTVGLTNVWRATNDALEKNQGVFIGLSSIHHLNHIDAYAVSKRCQEVLMMDMAKQRRLRVNILRLGHIVGTKAWPCEDPDRLPEIPLGRFGTPVEVAEAVLFMASAQWMTGSVVTLDGGISLGL